jgi:hypothetical protein
MGEPELTRALREIARRADPAPDLFLGVADRVRRRRHRRYAVGSAAAVVVLAFGGALATAVRPAPTPSSARATTPASTGATTPARTDPTPSARSDATPNTDEPSRAGASPTRAATVPGGPARCSSADLAGYFAMVAPPQSGGPALIGGITLYDKAAQPCRLADTISLTALDAAGRPVSVSGPTSRHLSNVVLPASSAENPVGLQVSLRGGGGATCPASDRVTPARFRFTFGAAVVEVPNSAHGTPLWGCRGAIALIAAG